MKKLKIKVFAISFCILSIVAISLFFINNIRHYNIVKNDIKSILSRNIVDENYINKRKDNPPEKEGPKFYLDYDVYTIIINNNQPLDIINHTEKNIDKEELENIYNKIINKNKKYYLGNLYTNKYSYKYSLNNNIILVDNTKTNKRLLTSLVSGFILLIVIELIVFYISQKLTKWIIDPVKESFERQKRFIADASHELKTPLAVMIASSDAYYKDGDKKWIDNMRRESERMTSLVTDLLDLSQIENNGNINFKEENLSEIIETTILTNECLFFESSIKLKYNITPNIIIECDKNQIKELITILIDNALKHAEEKSTVSINLFKENKEIILEVKNKGLPIPKGEEDKIFERFYKVDKSRNRNNNSYGLGLSIAKSIVENHNGIINANSHNKYITFKVYLRNQ